MSRAAALVLAAVFAWSGIAKLVRRPDLTTLGLPAWTPTALIAAELALVLTLVLSPVGGGIAALALLAGFTAFLVARRKSGVGCGCFGSSKAEPISSQDLMRNAVLLVIAALAAFA